MNTYRQPYPTQPNTPYTTSPIRRGTYPPPSPNYGVMDRYNVPHPSQSRIVPYATSSSHLDTHTLTPPPRYERDEVFGNRYIQVPHPSQISSTHRRPYPPPSPNDDDAGSGNQYQYIPPHTNHSSAITLYSAHRSSYPPPLAPPNDPVRSTRNPDIPPHSNHTGTLTVSSSRRASYPPPHTDSPPYDNDDDDNDDDPISTAAPIAFEECYIPSPHGPYYHRFISLKPRDPKAFGTSWRPSTPHPKESDLPVARERRKLIPIEFASVEEEEAWSSGLMLEHPASEEVHHDLLDQTAALQLGENQLTPGPRPSRANASDIVENSEEHIANQKLQSAMDDFVNSRTEETYDCLFAAVTLYTKEPQFEHSLDLVDKALQLLNSKDQHPTGVTDEFSMLDRPHRSRSPFVLGPFPES